MSTTTFFKDYNAARGPSPRLWGGFDTIEVIRDPSRGVIFWDDFIYPPQLATPTITTEANYGNGYKAFGESPSTILSVNPANGGFCELLMSDDNEACTLATISLPFKIIRGGGSLWFETRIKTLNITDSTLGWIVGLIDQQTYANDIPIVDAGTLATTINFCGFHRLEGDGDKVDMVYQANGVSPVTIEADAGTLAADTFLKLGFHYDDASFKLTHYVNGTPSATTKTIPTAAGTDFPNDVQLGLVCSILGANAADASVTMDWWKCAQYFP